MAGVGETPPTLGAGVEVEAQPATSMTARSQAKARYIRCSNVRDRRPRLGDGDALATGPISTETRGPHASAGGLDEARSATYGGFSVRHDGPMSALPPETLLVADTGPMRAEDGHP
jgi:hypothetical protein